MLLFVRYLFQLIWYSNQAKKLKNTVFDDIISLKINSKIIIKILALKFFFFKVHLYSRVYIIYK